MFLESRLIIKVENRDALVLPRAGAKSIFLCQLFFLLWSFSPNYIWKTGPQTTLNLHCWLIKVCWRRTLMLYFDLLLKQIFVLLIHCIRCGKVKILLRNASLAKILVSFSSLARQESIRAAEAALAQIWGWLPSIPTFEMLLNPLHFILEDLNLHRKHLVLILQVRHLLALHHCVCWRHKRGLTCLL